MAAIPALVSFSPNTKIVSADVNANFAAIRNAFNGTAVMTDTAATIAVTHIFNVSQTFKAGIAVSGVGTFTSGIAVSGAAGTFSSGITFASGATVTASGASIIGSPNFTGTPSFAAILVSGAAAVSGIATFAANVTLSASLNVAGKITATAAHTLGPLTIQATAVTGLSMTGGVSITQTVSSTVVLMNPSENSTFISVADASVTGSSAPTQLFFTTTWNTSGSPTFLKLVVNNTGSASGSKVFDCTVTAGSIFKIPIEGGAITQVATLATNATRGYLYIPTTPTTASGVAVGETGCVPLCYDTTNNKLQVYNGGAWKVVTLA